MHFLLLTEGNLGFAVTFEPLFLDTFLLSSLLLNFLLGTLGLLGFGRYDEGKEVVDDSVLVVNSCLEVIHFWLVGCICPSFSPHFTLVKH